MKNTDNVVMMVATHRTKYLPQLLKKLESLPYQKIVNVEMLRVASNAQRTWDYARLTGKRYVVMMDDDIEILQDDIIERAIEVLEENNWAMCVPYETYNSNYELGKHKFEVREREWMPGYFVVIDTEKMKGYEFDNTLNDNEDHVDLDMSLYAHSLGYKMGMVDRIIIHYTDNHLPESMQIMREDGHSQYFMAHGNLEKKWSMPSPIVPGKSVYKSVYVKSKNVYSSIS